MVPNDDATADALCCEDKMAYQYLFVTNLLISIDYNVCWYVDMLLYEFACLILMPFPTNIWIDLNVFNGFSLLVFLLVFNFTFQIDRWWWFLSFFKAFRWLIFIFFVVMLTGFAKFWILVALPLSLFKSFCLKGKKKDKII